jgi:hypothetical protein
MVTAQITRTGELDHKCFSQADLRFIASVMAARATALRLASVVWPWRAALSSFRRSSF